MHDMRIEYRDGGEIIFPEKNSPLSLLKLWISEAKDKNVIEPNAMCLSTIDQKGKPNSRIVLLKHLDEGKVGFFTNLESDKSKQIENQNHVSATFWWPTMERQVRIAGKAELMPRKNVNQYHNSRPRKSQISAWVSKQSKVLDSKDTLKKEFTDFEKKYAKKNIPVPPFWGGYYIIIDSIEYWSGRPSRLHERIRLSKHQNKWIEENLYP